MSHKSFGPVPENKFKEAIDAPAGKAGTILREFAPSFGLGSPGAEKQKYRVTFVREATAYERAEADIDATSEQEARGIAQEIKASDLKWFEDGSDEPDDHWIDTVERAT